MAKTLVFEGCPACSKGGDFGAFPLSSTQKDLMIDMVKGGAIGAGGATILDFIMTKVPYVDTLDVRVKPLINAALLILSSAYIYQKNPSIATGIGIGGASVALYKFIQAMMGKIIVQPVVAAATAGMGYLRPKQDNGDFQIANDGTGVIIARQYAGYGMQDEYMLE